MFKTIVAVTAVLVGLTGPQILPAQAYCPMDLDYYEYSRCLDNEQRLEDIERRQRQIQRKQECLASGNTFC